MLSSSARVAPPGTRFQPNRISIPIHNVVARKGAGFHRRLIFNFRRFLGWQDDLFVANLWDDNHDLHCKIGAKVL